MRAIIKGNLLPGIIIISGAFAVVEQKINPPPRVLYQRILVMSPKEKNDEENKVKINEEEMNCVYNSIYFSLNKKLQIYSGLWPYESRASKMFRRFILYAILFLAFIPLVSSFLWINVNKTHILAQSQGFVSG